jgi:DNA polymerase-3 subunit alpha
MDFHGKIDIMIFERDLEKLEEFNLDEPIAIKAFVDKNGEFIRVSCRKILTLQEAKNETAAQKKEQVILKREISHNYKEDLQKIYNEIKQNPGEKDVVLIIKTPFDFTLKVIPPLKTSLNK